MGNQSGEQISKQKAEIKKVEKDFRFLLSQLLL